MFSGFDALGFAAIGEAPENRVAAAGSSEAGIDWEVIIHAAKHEYISRLSDEPADQIFRGTLEKAFRFDRSIVGNDRIGEAVAIGLGEVRLSNLEADYDFTALDHTPLGQRVTIRRGDRRRPYSEWQTMLEGYLVDQDIDRDGVTFRLRDAGHKLDVAVSPNAYAGTGGTEGGEDLKGKRKPKGYGHLFNVTPPLVIPSALAHQVNDGPINGIGAVYIRGVGQTFTSDHVSVAAMNAASLGIGQYATCLAEGWFRIAVASGTEIGQVTCDFSGDKTGGVFVSTTADIVKRLLTGPAGLSEADDLVGVTFDDLNAAQPAPVGYYAPVGGDETVAAVVAKLMAGIGGWCGSRRTGRFEVKRFSAPAGIAAGVYDRTNIGDVKTVPMPSGLQPPPWRIRVGYARNWTVQTDVAGSVSATRLAFLKEELRFAAAENLNVRADFPPGHELTVDYSYFRDEADALAEATRRLALFGTARALYAVKPSLPYAHELGQVIRVDFPRFDLDGGKALRLVKIVEDDAEGVELIGFG